MKTSLLFQLAFVLLMGCNKADDLGPAELTGCTNVTGANCFRVLKNVDTFVFSMTNTRQDGTTFDSYFIKNDDADGLTQPLVPCNLPEEYQKNGLRIRFSGHALSFLDHGFGNSIGLPIELTHIKKR
ncbi:hypothetical protein [Dyadobacter sp. CY312]|uniref:hypothetical protein n=1 Tax=Dyadobacter sp. CY312 TaxID=2907303 RepID=UPI001F27DEBD|nr:hypothetical protein [Dyadobacter sp. CY312]MCE7042496.1 hypothetical protein [Dyadobacter sp. CY312]